VYWTLEQVDQKATREDGIEDRQTSVNCLCISGMEGMYVDEVKYTYRRREFHLSAGHLRLIVGVLEYF
jgi:hypothetical protein